MSIDQAIQRAAAAGAAVVGRGRTEKDVAAMVEKFGRHPDGYLHARVVIDGKRFYFHRKYGSWLAPGTMEGHEALKEPEGLLGSTLGAEIKFELSRRSAPYDDQQRREREEEVERAKQSARTPEDGRVDDAPERPDRLPGGGDQGDAAPEIRPE